jgi:hypothetical protein
MCHTKMYVWHLTLPYFCIQELAGTRKKVTDIDHLAAQTAAGQEDLSPSLR